MDLMTGTPRLVADLLYGAGLRLLECLTLRVKDVDVGRNEIVVQRVRLSACIIRQRRYLAARSSPILNLASGVLNPVRKDC